MKIVIASSGQPSTNPRMVREADALANSGHDVLVIYAHWTFWATPFDQQMLKAKKWKAIIAGGSPSHSPLTYFISRLCHKLSSFLARNVSMRYFSKLAISRSSKSLICKVKQQQADVYIAHNLGALPAIVIAAKHHHKPCGFDAEDLHRYEVSNDNQDYDVQLKTHIEQKYIPELQYLTTSSPQINAAYQSLFPASSPVCLLNVTDKPGQTSVRNIHPDDPIRLFWCSQTIGLKRGIEDVIGALRLISTHTFELHLMGSQQHGETKTYFTNLMNAAHPIFFHGPVTPELLVAHAARFDIGLALEPGFSINNDLALSNKIFTYIQAGLAVVASNTTAQQAFMASNPEIGHCYEIGGTSTLAAILCSYAENRGLLDKTRKASCRLGQDHLNWETEKLKFLKIIDTLPCP
ncbi:hypothetical protein PBAL39_05023 [Pedobacter sp. BAL39]|uniref:hypothetical protein n=1 Tax=Pedobacter sp. BAL39 TaxID=391596 RepID=UPI00015593EF|nr:hypothetical protein [Pedobacter sp. BAL39]EDM37133.1 hypothetical protein PBAL39_05023 [Pedobacter sp. BAL39]